MGTFRANAVLLKDILREIKDGKLQLPDFQRGWVWDDVRIKELLISMSRGFPIGAVMTLNTGGDVRFESRLVEGVASNGTGEPEAYLLDGQQRLTSLYQTLLFEGPVETRLRPGSGPRIKRYYYIDIEKMLDSAVDRDDTIISVPEDRVMRSNFGRDVDLDLSSRELEFEHHMVPTEMVMGGSAWGYRYTEYWTKRGDHPHGDPFKYFDSFEKVALDNFTDYQLPVINLGKETSKEAVCTVFEKVNTGGVTLSVFELVTASFAADDFRLRDDWAKRRARLHETRVLRGVSEVQFLQAVTLLATQARRRKARSEGKSPQQTPGVDCRRASILNLELSEYLDWADRVEAGFQSAAKFLNNQYIFVSWNIPYNTQLVPLAAMHVELGHELAPAKANDKLERWFWCGVLGEMYGGGVETQFANDLVQVARYIRGGDEPQLVTEANFVPERLLSLRTRVSAAYKGVYALQMKGGAADWRTERKLAVADFFGEAIDIHHIFPRRWCEQDADPAIPRWLCDSIINKTPIDAWTNRIIGGNAPSKYLPRLREDIDGEKLERVLEAHWIDPDGLERDDFRHCFVERAQAMLDLINWTMGKPMADHRQTFRDTLDSAGLVAGQDEGQRIE